MADVDSILFVSFGGPEKLEDVLPFLRNVTRGRDVPPARLAQVAPQYEMFGGRSPINEQNRALIASIVAELKRCDLDLPVFFGNRNWHPFLTDTIAEMSTLGHRHALAFVTSAFSSYSGCGQYIGNIAAAIDAAGSSIEVVKLRPYFNHPEFIAAFVENLSAVLSTMTRPHIVFTAHSIPQSMADRCAYAQQLNESARLIMQSVERDDWSLAFQSRSGSPATPWLGPGINEHLHALHDAGVFEVAVVPLGFVSDHMEVLFDLDTQAAKTAAELGIRMERVATPSTSPHFVTMVRELIEEVVVPGTPQRAVGDMGVATCSAGSCCGLTQ